MNRKSLVPAAVLAVLIGGAILATRRDFRYPNPRLFHDMMYSPAPHTEMTTPMFADGRELRVPPAGTVARGQTPLLYGPGDKERARAGRELKNPFPPTDGNVARGRAVYENYCQHCHGAQGLGDGAVAQDYPGFAFPAAAAARTMPDGEIFHVITFGHNLMPAHGAMIPADDRWKVVDYLRRLQNEDVAALAQDPRRSGPASASYGRRLFAQNCAACHGEDGLHPKPGIPTLHLPPVLAIADDDYYAATIRKGRPSAGMPSWEGTLSPSQIQSLVLYIRSWAWKAPEFQAYSPVASNPRRGQELFQQHCVGCHAPDGSGGIGISLNTPNFQALASDDFLRLTIAHGRAWTAMPASYDLSGKDVDALVSFIRTWKKAAPAYDAVAALKSKASVADGGKLFAAKCAGCHAADGSGALASSLSAQSFQSMIDDKFLYTVITRGRPGTGMPSWSQLGAQDLANVIAFVQSWGKGPKVTLTWNKHHGDASRGKKIFTAECVKCHGAQGQGGMGTQIGNPALLTQDPDDFLWRTVAYGKTGTQMQGFLKRARNPLTSEQIDDVIAYVRRLQSHPPFKGLWRYDVWADAGEGKKVYETKANCARCHGAGGEGGIGPTIGGPGFLAAASDGYIEGMAAIGRDGTAMQSYYDGSAGVTLTNDDLDNVTAYVRQFQTHPTTARRLVESSSDRISDGYATFQKNCVRCHGEGGAGGRAGKSDVVAPALNDPEFLKAVTDGFLQATIAMGRPGTPMPPFGPGMRGEVGHLSTMDIQEVVAYIRSLGKKGVIYAPRSGSDDGF